MGSYSQVTEFILVGLSSDPVLQIPLYIFFLTIYMMTVTGNFLLIVAVRLHNGLHNPMYLFLVSLSFVDICSTSTTIPNLLVNFLTGNNHISFAGCLGQSCSFIFLIATECVLLSFMAYDRYVAICNPLRYSTIMKTMTCMIMTSASWLISAVISSVFAYFLSQLRYCGSNTINNLFCEAGCLMLLSCSDLFIANLVNYIEGFLVLFLPLLFILYSYILIIVAVLRIRSRRYKAFSTCVSHLTVVIIFYGSIIFLYMKSPKKRNLADNIFSVFYSAITPMLNPLIYSLKNKEVHEALKNMRNVSNYFKNSQISKKVKLKI